MKYLGRAVEERTSYSPSEEDLTGRRLWRTRELLEQTRRLHCLVNVSRQPEGQADRSSDLPDVRPHVLQLATLLPPPPMQWLWLSNESTAESGSYSSCYFSIEQCGRSTYFKCTYTWTCVATGPSPTTTPHTLTTQNMYVHTELSHPSMCVASTTSSLLCIQMHRFELSSWVCPVCPMAAYSRWVTIVTYGSGSLYMCCGVECITFNHVIFYYMQRVASSDSAVGTDSHISCCPLES